MEHGPNKKYPGQSSIGQCSCLSGSSQSRTFRIFGNDAVVTHGCESSIIELSSSAGTGASVHRVRISMPCLYGARYRQKRQVKPVELENFIFGRHRPSYQKSAAIKPPIRLLSDSFRVANELRMICNRFRRLSHKFRVGEEAMLARNQQLCETSTLWSGALVYGMYHGNKKRNIRLKHIGLNVLKVHHPIECHDGRELTEQFKPGVSQENNVST